jgi:hypothetical protein
MKQLPLFPPSSAPKQSKVIATLKPKRQPDFICSDCNLACFIEEHGYCGGHDDEPIQCRDCNKQLGTFSTTGFLTKTWQPAVTA